MEADMETPIVNEIVKKLGKLPNKLQQQVLTYVESLQIPAPGVVSGQQLLQFAGTIPKEDLTIMQEAIEKGCEHVDINEW